MSEFSRQIGLEGLKPGASEFEFEASEEECRALAARLGILDCHQAKVTGSLALLPGCRDIELKGRVSASVEQSCSITLKPVQEKIDTSFEIRFSDQIEEETPIGEVEKWSEDSCVEPMPSGPLDVGEIAAQYMSMSINPFPRVPGAKLDVSGLEGVAIMSEEAVCAAASPFAKLKKIKDGG